MADLPCRDQAAHHIGESEGKVAVEEGQFLDVDLLDQPVCQRNEFGESREEEFSPRDAICPWHQLSHGGYAGQGVHGDIGS
ncbi:MAG: hypothetical protein V9F03_14735 [Microthrixaceae bacterium]